MKLNPLAWRGLVVLLAIWAIVQLLPSLEFRNQLAPELDIHHQIATITEPHHLPDVDRWQYEWERDRDDLVLTSQQCEKAFPQLYHEIDRAADYWRHRELTTHAIALYENANESGLRVLLHDGRLRIIHSKGMERKDFRSRILAILFQIQLTVTSATATNESIPDTEFNFVVDDWPNLWHDDDAERSVWSFARDLHDRSHDGVWLMPDFHFWAGDIQDPPFSEMQRKARVHDSSLELKKPQAVWRGVAWTAPELRGALLEVSQRQAWADVREIGWEDRTNLDRPNFMQEDDYCDYRFLINTEGRSWSSRLTAILNCDAVPILHELRWQAHYYHLLEAKVNYLPVRNDFTDLEERVEDFIADAEGAQEIADRARQTFRERYTTPAATACYWRRLLRAWGKLAFEPEVYRATSGEGETTQRLKGISFEEFLLDHQETDYRGDNVE